MKQYLIALKEKDAEWGTLILSVDEKIIILYEGDSPQLALELGYGINRINTNLPFYFKEIENVYQRKLHSLENAEEVDDNIYNSIRNENKN